MKEFKGTKGPWEVYPEEVDKPYIRIRGTQLGQRFKVSSVITPVYEGVLEREAKETRANAHLIAAAPDLLEALQDLLHAYDNKGERPAWNSARAAITKALGETK